MNYQERLKLTKLVKKTVENMTDQRLLVDIEEYPKDDQVWAKIRYMPTPWTDNVVNSTSEFFRETLTNICAIQGFRVTFNNNNTTIIVRAIKDVE